jgi:hypothetical protein
VETKSFVDVVYCPCLDLRLQDVQTTFRMRAKLAAQHSLNTISARTRQLGLARGWPGGWLCTAKYLRKRRAVVSYTVAQASRPQELASSNNGRAVLGGQRAERGQRTRLPLHPRRGRRGRRGPRKPGNSGLCDSCGLRQDELERERALLSTAQSLSGHRH